MVITMKKWVKTSIFIAVALLMVVFVIASMNKSVKADLFKVTKTDVTYKFKEKGISSSAGETKIFCPVSGDVGVVNVKEGDRVNTGDVIIRLDTRQVEYQIQQLNARISSLEGQKTTSSSTIRQQIAQLQAQISTVNQQEKDASNQVSQQQKVVDNADADQQMAQINFDRTNNLYNSGAVSKKELDDAQYALNQAENNLAVQKSSLDLIIQRTSTEGDKGFYALQKKSLQTQIDILNYELSGSTSGASGQGKYYSGLANEARTNINQLNDQINRSTVTAPFSGTIKQISIQKGETVSSVTPIAIIIPDEYLGIDAYVLARDVIYFMPNDIVSIIQERKEEDAIFKGHISSIAPAAIPKVSALGLEEQRVKITIFPDALIPDIRPGYEFEIEFYPITQKNVIAVPASAIFSSDNGDAVWVVENNKVVLRNIEKGITADEMTVVKTGISEGETVVKDSRQEGIIEGIKVK